MTKIKRKSESNLPNMTIYYTEKGGILYGVRSPIGLHMAHFTEAVGGNGVTLCGVDCKTWKVRDVEGAKLCNNCRIKATQL